MAAVVVVVGCSVNKDENKRYKYSNIRQIWDMCSPHSERYMYEWLTIIISNDQGNST